MLIQAHEGYANFKHPSLPKDRECRTWYRIVGALPSKSGRPVLVTLHGGPGATHDYLKEPFTSYAAKTGTPVILYDQIGNGKSTHLREKRLDESFWVPDLFVAELDNLLRHLGIRDAEFDLYGQSWGAMLAAKYAVSPVSRGSGLRKMIMGSGPCNMTSWGKAAAEIMAGMPRDIRETIEKYAKRGEWDNPRYKSALAQVYAKHMCRLDPWPKILADSFDWLEKDDTVYLTMTGPDEIHTIGNLRNFDMSEECKAIKVPCLLINGEFDQCADICVQPWFDGIPKAKWATIPDSSHMCHLEKSSKYTELVGSFLGGN